MTAATLAKTYTSIHSAIATVAGELQIEPFAVRILLALDDVDQPINTNELADRLDTEPSHVRRVGPGVHAKGLVKCVAQGGGHIRQGHFRLYSLSEKGRDVVDRVVELAGVDA